MPLSHQSGGQVRNCPVACQRHFSSRCSRGALCHGWEAPRASAGGTLRPGLQHQDPALPVPYSLLHMARQVPGETHPVLQLHPHGTAVAFLPRETRRLWAGTAGRLAMALWTQPALAPALTLATALALVLALVSAQAPSVLVPALSSAGEETPGAGGGRRQQVN